MPNQSKLRGFLRKEILRSRIAEEKLVHCSKKPSMIFKPSASPPYPLSITSAWSDGTDGLFDHRLSLKQTKDQDPVLGELKEKLTIIITNETGADGFGQEEFRRKRYGLIREIRRLEAEEKARKEQALKLRLDQRLPEPIGAAEKRRLRLAAQKASKALAGLENSSKKRVREDPDHDLDGEERLRLGKGIKKRRTEITGHWKASIHNYFPHSHLGGEKDSIFESLSTSDRQRLRRELAEYGEKLARAARKKRALKDFQ